MPRLARIVAPGLPHHVTQRGNRRQATFFDGATCHYRSLLTEHARAAGVAVWAGPPETGPQAGPYDHPERCERPSGMSIVSP